jgi:hypothetical protein
MPTLPAARADIVDFFEAHLPVWAVDPAAIGLTPLQVSDLTTQTATARAALDSQTAAINIKLAATADMYNEVDVLKGTGAELIKVIGTYAQLTNDPGVYAAAQIPAPAPPTPAGPPPQPTNLAASVLLPFGIGLAWKGSVSQGAYFAIYRQLPGQAEFTLVATTKKKSFDDLTLPASSVNAAYYIAAIRESFQVNSVSIVIQFGSSGMTSMTLAA